MWCQDLIQQSTFQPSYTSFKEPRLSFINILFRTDWINVDSILPVPGDGPWYLITPIINIQYAENYSNPLTFKWSTLYALDDYYFITGSKHLSRTQYLIEARMFNRGLFTGNESLFWITGSCQHSQG